MFINEVSNDLLTRKVEINNLRADLQDKQKRYEREKLNEETTRKKLDHIMDKTVSLDEKANELKEYLREEEQKNKELEKEIKRLKEIRK
jgi:peptidoglycan hydrolase CwlO-like protein